MILWNAFSWGVVFFNFYNWFIFPVFGFGMMPEIVLSQAIGIMLVIGLFKNHDVGTLKEEFYANDFISRMLLGLASPWLTLCIGWLVKNTLL